MSGKWNDISTAEMERYELLAPTTRGVVMRPCDEPGAAFAAFVEERDGTQHRADRTFGDLTEAKIWAEQAMEQALARQAGV